jgi:hypothetical protein
MDKTVKEIVEINKEVLEDLANASWVFSYDKQSDMMRIEDTSTVEHTFYVPLEDTRFMFKVDKDYVLHGFAIENTTYFVRENPEFFLPLARFVYPVRYQFLSIIIRAIWGMSRVAQSLAMVRDYAVARTA